MTWPAMRVRCFPLQSSGREVGVVNFYYERETEPEADANVFFAESLTIAGLHWKACAAATRKLPPPLSSV